MKWDNHGVIGVVVKELSPTSRQVGLCKHVAIFVKMSLLHNTNNNDCSLATCYVDTHSSQCGTNMACLGTEPDYVLCADSASETPSVNVVSLGITPAPSPVVAAPSCSGSDCTGDSRATVAVSMRMAGIEMVLRGGA